MADKEIMKTKREFNARARELTANGYKKYGDSKKSCGFYRCCSWGLHEIVLRRGWMKA